MARLKQERMFEETDTKLTKVCDEFLEAKAKHEVAASDFEAAETNLLVEMKNAKKASVRHGDRTIRISVSSPKEKIKVS